MKKIDLGQTMTTLANLGVIIGIVFLAVEINQNNRLLSTQASQVLLQNRIVERNQIWADPEIAEFMFRVSNGEQLESLDRYRWKNRVEATIIGFEWEYQQFVAGSLSELPLQAWRRFLSNPQYIIEWELIKPILTDDFVSFIENEVLED